MARNRLLPVALAVGTAVASFVVVAPAASAVPAPPVPPPAAIEPLPTPYVPAVTCDPVARPGLSRFAALVQAAYPGTGSSGTVNTCAAEGMASEHTEGRAWDWTVNVNRPDQVAQVDDALAWLLAPDAAGNQAANARRLGIMYVIWNKQILGLYALSAGWQPYSCSGVTACHQDHVHFSFTWAGAMGRTSFWTGTVAPADYGPCRGPGQMFALPYTAPNPVRCPSPGTLPPGSPVTAALAAARGTTLAQGATGPAVAAVQQALGGTAPTGSFGAATRDLVTTFQERRGLPTTGTVDGPTLNALLNYSTDGLVTGTDQRRGDLYLGVGSGTGSGATEVHALTRASGYAAFSVHAATALGPVDLRTTTLLFGSYDGTGNRDLYVVIGSGTATGKVEVHVLSAASNYTTWVLHVATPLPAVAPGTWQFRLSQPADGSPADLVGVLGNGASGKVEVHALSRANNYTTWTLHEATALAPAPAGTWDYLVAPPAPGAPAGDLVAVNRGTGASGRVEVHTLAAASGYRQFTVHAATAFMPAVSAAQEFSLADLDADGRPDLVGTFLQGGGSARTEFHALSGGSGYTTWLDHTATALGQVDPVRWTATATG